MSSLVLNWVVGAALMFALAWMMLPDLPEYRTGLIIVGLARCIAMVIIWNDLACGDREAAAVLVAINSVFQVLMFAVLGWFYLSVLPGWLGLEQTGLDVSPWQIAESVLIFLGIPLIAGFLTRRFGEKVKGRTWYEDSFLPRIGPWALYGLLFTIVMLFALQGEQITSQPLDVVRIALPLLAYFAIMWGGGYLVGAAIGLGYERTTTLAFTAAGNNFELAIAVAIGTFGVASGQALAGGRRAAHRGPGTGCPGVRLARPARPLRPPKSCAIDRIERRLSRRRAGVRFVAAQQQDGAALPSCAAWAWPRRCRNTRRPLRRPVRPDAADSCQRCPSRRGRCRPPTSLRRGR